MQLWELTDLPMPCLLTSNCGHMTYKSILKIVVAAIQSGCLSSSTMVVEVVHLLLRGQEVPRKGDEALAKENGQIEERTVKMSPAGNSEMQAASAFERPSCIPLGIWLLVLIS